jgi:hypothetical protein
LDATIQNFKKELLRMDVAEKNKLISAVNNGIIKYRRLLNIKRYTRKFWGEKEKNLFYPS